MVPYPTFGRRARRQLIQSAFWSRLVLHARLAATRGIIYVQHSRFASMPLHYRELVTSTAGSCADDVGLVCPEELTANGDRIHPALPNPKTSTKPALQAANQASGCKSCRLLNRISPADPNRVATAAGHK
jgi:hypothetical protein